MNSRTYVCPHEPDLLAGLHGRSIVVRVPQAGRIPAAALAVTGSGNTLHHVIVESGQPLDGLEWKPEWFTAPAVLSVPAMGPFRKLVGRLSELRKAAVQVWLPCREENLTSIRLLASVGIACGVVFGQEEPPWESLSDLMTYAILGPAPRAAIEPFASIARHLQPGDSGPRPWFNWNRVFFDDPAEFLHLDGQGRVALSRRDLLSQQFAGQSVDDPALESAIESRKYAWQKLFLDHHPCSCCPGWRICLGKFADGPPRPDGCAGFVTEMMDVIDTSRAARPERRAAV